MKARVISFGYVSGPLTEPVDITIDLHRLLETSTIRSGEPSTGLHPDIAATVMAVPGARRLVDNLGYMLVALVTGPAGDRDQALTVAVGCDHGLHWSVAVAEQIHRTLAAAGIDTEVHHRQIAEPPHQ